jgi:cytochrome c oxidase accessory protein FixG
MARIDIPARRLTLLGASFTPADTIFLFLMLIIGVFGLFLLTAAFGRVWCGWGCPQTVFLEEWIRPIEHLVEGERGVRIKRDRGPWSFDKAWRKGVKWALFLMVAVIVGFSFTGWFVDPMLLWSGRAGTWATAFALLLTTLIFLDFAWFREQFCNYLCPYARFQGALTDTESMIIAYDTDRGEPRGPRKSKLAAAARAAQEPKSSGACIDCNACVTVCPNGIDIRNGMQLECVSCARCVDACEGVMGRLHEAPLIRYAPVRPRFMRPRTMAYAGILFTASAAFLFAMTAHRSLEVNINRAPGSLYVVDPDGWVRNTFLVRVANNDLGAPAQSYDLHAVGLPEQAEVVTAPATVPAGQQATVPFVVRLPPGAARTLAFDLEVRGDDAAHTARAAATFKGDGT